MLTDHLTASHHSAAAIAVHGRGLPRRVLLIHNPVAGHRHAKRLAAVIGHLCRMRCPVTIVDTHRRGDAERLAREASPEDFDMVVAAGGDGTINEIVNGLVSGRGGLDLGILPLGTANVLAHEIGLDLADDHQIAAIIAGGSPRSIHLGLANGRHFALMAGVGFDAHVVETISRAPKRPNGKMAYVVEGMRRALDYDFPKLEIRADGRTFEGAMAVACKGRYYGGPFVAAPGARLDEPKLHICVLPKSGAAGAMRYGLALPMGRLAALPEVQVIAAENIVIRGQRGAPVQGDGDIVARLPVEISISRQMVNLVMPEPRPLM